jgi:hypothetical protein
MKGLVSRRSKKNILQGDITISDIRVPLEIAPLHHGKMRNGSYLLTVFDNMISYCQ